MATISVSLPSDGTTADVSDYNTPITTIVNEFNGNIDNDNIKTAAAISTAKLASDGFLTSWASWTPTFTNVSGGTVTYAKYVTIGKTVHFRLKYTLADANVSGAILFTLPTATNSDYAQNDTIGTASILDSGTAGYLGFLMLNSTSQAEIRPIGAGGTYSTYTTAASSTTPHTWAASDFFQCSGTYEIA